MTPKHRELCERLNEHFEWLRKPDYAEEFSLIDIVEWLNERKPSVIPPAAAAITSLSEENERLRRVLGPLVRAFAELRAEDCPKFRLDPDEPVTISHGALLVGDVWRARAALGGKP